MLKRYKDAMTVPQRPSRLCGCKDKALTGMTDMRAEDRLHVVILPKKAKGMLHYCTQTMPSSEDGRIIVGGLEGIVSETQSLLLYQCLCQITPRDCP